MRSYIVSTRLGYYEVSVFPYAGLTGDIWPALEEVYTLANRVVNDIMSEVDQYDIAYKEAKRALFKLAPSKEILELLDKERQSFRDTIFGRAEKMRVCPVTQDGYYTIEPFSGWWIR